MFSSQKRAWVIGFMCEGNAFGAYYFGRQDVVVGIATCYGMDGPGIESRRDIPCSSRLAPRQTQPLIKCVQALSQR